MASARAFAHVREQALPLRIVYGRRGHWRRLGETESMGGRKGQFGIGEVNGGPGSNRQLYSDQLDFSKERESSLCSEDKGE